ncbi:MAG: hypothetical protein WCQ32_01435 [bacterium]
MESSLFWSHALMHSTPLYVFVIAHGIMYSMLLLGRKVFEGHAYDVSLSSRYGDIGLTAFCIYAGYILQQHEAREFIGSWMENPVYHYCSLGAAVICAAVYFIDQKPKYEMDGWHAIVVVPLFVYFIGTLAPVYYYFGSPVQIAIGVLFLVSWIIFLIIDIREERLNQRMWLAIHKPWVRFKK